MKSIKGSRIVAVADSDHHHGLAARRRRMEMVKVTAVPVSRRQDVYVRRARPMLAWWQLMARYS